MSDYLVSWRKVLFVSMALVVIAVTTAQAQQRAGAPAGQRPNIVVIFGDDIGVPQISAYTMGMMGYRTPNARLGADRQSTDGPLRALA
jgi:hypothetical protein